jgi:starvation-inducible outer membrane lipoprotein
MNKSEAMYDIEELLGEFIRVYGKFHTSSSKWGSNRKYNILWARVAQIRIWTFIKYKDNKDAGSI